MSRIQPPAFASEIFDLTMKGLEAGLKPQDLKYRGERTRLVIGDRNVVREFVTVNPGTGGGGGLTRIGSDNLFMVYAHVAHDCLVGHHTIFANGATLAGHVEVGDWATIGAFSGVHQFCRVGTHSFVGGYTVVTKDVLPYSKTVGNRACIYGVNSLGLTRRGFDPERMARYDRRKIAHLLQDPGIVRNRQKVNAAIGNARAFLEFQERGASFGDFLWGFVGGAPKQYRRRAVRDLPARSRESDAMSAALVQRGFRFVGPTICYAFMQAVGMVNDHLVTCFRHAEVERLSRAAR